MKQLPSFLRVVLIAVFCAELITPPLWSAGDNPKDPPPSPEVSASQAEQENPTDGETSAIVFEEDKENAPTALAEAPALQSEAQAMARTEGISWADNKEALLAGLLNLQAKAFQKVERIREALGEQGLMDSINRGEVREEGGSFGRAEVTTVDGHIFCRIVHNATGVSFLMLEQKTPSNPDGVDPDSKHLKQIVARQHIEAGEGRNARDLSGNEIVDSVGRPNKETGRHVVKVWLIQGAIHKTQMEQKSRVGAAQWWKDYFYSKWKKPTVNDFTMSLFAGALMQGTLTAAAVALKSHFFGTEFTWYPVMLSASFGIGVGTMVSFYKNLTNSGSSRFRRVLKSATVSVLYAYALVLGTHSGGLHGVLHDYLIHMPSAPLSLWTLASLHTLGLHAAIGLNILMSNYSKDYWYRLIAFRTRFRENVGTVKVSWLRQIGINRDINFRWNKSSFENQMVYLVPWILNVLSLMGFSVAITHTDIRIPVLHLMSIPIAQYLLVKYTKHLAEKRLNDPETFLKGKDMMAYADDLKVAWDHTWGIDVKDIPTTIVQQVSRITKRIEVGEETIMERCRSFLDFLLGPL